MPTQKEKTMPICGGQQSLKVDTCPANSVRTRGIVKTSGFTRVFVKIGDFIKFNGLLVEFLKNRRSSENQ